MLPLMLTLIETQSGGMQDVPQFGPLAATMFGQMVSDPLFVPHILKHVGIGPFVDWWGVNHHLNFLYACRTAWICFAYMPHRHAALS